MGEGLTLIQVAVPERGVAECIAEDIVTEKLAVCAQVGNDISSFYWWQGVMERNGEVLLLIKTDQSRRDACVRRIVELHPYELPVVEWWQAAANAGVAEWLARELR